MNLCSVGNLKSLCTHNSTDKYNYEALALAVGQTAWHIHCLDTRTICIHHVQI
jgi:hypothetical protein